MEGYIKLASIGLAIGVGGRLILDYTMTGDPEVLGRGVVGMTVGVLIAEFAKQALESYISPPEPELKRRHRHRRIHTRHDEEVVEGAVPVTPNTAAAMAAVRPRPTVVAAVTGPPTASASTVPTVTIAPPVAPSIRVPIISAGVARDMLRTGRRDIEGDEESEESLERDVNEADGRRRKLQEEREWARAQGDAARSAQLDAEIKRYRALSAELERRLSKRRSMACE
jgi:hypothetical protein